MTQLSRIAAAAVFLAVIFVAMLPLGETLGANVALTFAAINAVIVSIVVWLSRSGYRAWGHGFLFGGLLMLARPLMRQTSGSGAAAGTADASAGIGQVVPAGLHWTPLLITDMGVGLLFLVLGMYLSLSDRKEIVRINGRLAIRRVQESR
ncbi:MAG: hypothetical protein CML66_28765 [Rhodobacteraceae bacterium]|nr:hypothetical protein [Paracoccaceae bacterium]MAY44068.1 hypothetical protein [Paracoccaceae bacterium]|tara:strand:+ start:204 stop:653 length:450 start_codon:yes stop_codon:yes gene_type:complete